MKITLERKTKKSKVMVILNPILFTLLALAACGIILGIMGFNPLEVYTKMISKAFFSTRGLRKSITAGLPLMLCGLGVAIGYKMNLNNIGAEGQYAVGALCGGAWALFGPQLPGFLGILVMFFICFAGGALWAFVCALLKAYWNVNEIITTLMLNYIALILMDFFCLGPWKEPKQNVGQTSKIPENLRLPNIPGTSISLGFLIALLMAVLLYLFFKYTTTGYQVTVIKNSMTAARYAGMNIKKCILTVLTISGGLAGLAGFVQVSGVVGRVQAGMPNNAGYTAIVIAYLANFNPIAVIIVSILFGGLQNSSATVQVMGVPSDIATMMQGAIMLFVIAGSFFHKYKLLFQKKSTSLKGGETA